MKMMKVEKSAAEFDSVVEAYEKRLPKQERARKHGAKFSKRQKILRRIRRKKVFASDKLKDAEYLGENSILLIVEGNSAAASMAIARDITKYGILAIRGKMLNCLAHPEEKNLSK